MFKRFRDAISQRQKALQQDAEFNSKKAEVKDCLQSVGTNWRFVEESLLFEDPTTLCIGHVTLTLLFWVFLNSTWRMAAVVLDCCLVAVSLSSDLRNAWWNNLQRYFNFHIEDSRLGFTFDEVCSCLASAWIAGDNGINYLKHLKDQAPHKLGLIVGIMVIILLFLVAYVPFTEVLYGGGSLCMFYLPLTHYGILQRIIAKLYRIAEPAIIHWQHSQTRRRRDDGKFVPMEFDDIATLESDSDDEFALYPSHATSEILSAAVNDDKFDLSDSTELDHEDIHGLGVSYDSRSSEDDFHGDGMNFTAGLTSMPSLSHYDSLMEPVDEFHEGLQFPDHNVSMSYSAPTAPLTVAREDLTDDDADDIPFDEQKRTEQHEENGFEFVEHSDVDGIELDNATDISSAALPTQDHTRDDVASDLARSQWLGY